MAKMIEFFLSLDVLIELVVMGKEYYQKTILKYLDEKELVYIVPVRESKKLKAMKEAALNNPKKRIQSCEMKDDQVKEKGNPLITFNTAFYGKRSISFGKLRAHYTKATKDLKDVLSNIFVLGTNGLVQAPSIKKKYKFYKTRKEHGGR
ncbi:MAG: hypothetical protein ACTSVV_00645 [Promethearchaeota archaeon]